MPTLPFKTLQELDLPITEMVGGRIGCIHDAFLTFPYEVCETLPREERDLVVLVGKGKQGARLRAIAEHPGRVVVIFAPGDGPLPPAYSPGRTGLPQNVAAVFSTNNLMADPRAVSVPLGVRTTKLAQLQFVRQNHRGGREGLAYANFALDDEHYRPDRAGRPHVRARIADRLGSEPWLETDIARGQRNDPGQLIRYYAEIAAHRFALSPQGNGIDCYRTWEILYLGAIPIVMTSEPMSAFADLPILFTTDYSELSEEYLEQRWAEMSARSYEIDRMLKSWYMRRFLEEVSALERPRFVCWRADELLFDRAVRALARSSRSVAGLVIETPTPPFTGRRSLLEPDHWRASGALELQRVDGALELRPLKRGRHALEMPLQTIAGAPFRLTGKVRLADGAPLVLTSEAREHLELLAVAEVDVEAGREADLCLDFVARSQRTSLGLGVRARSPAGRALLTDLEVQAMV